MPAFQLEWDPRKAATNRRDHGGSFEEAIDVFHDPLARLHADPGSSASELREIILSGPRRRAASCWSPSPSVATVPIDQCKARNEEREARL